MDSETKIEDIKQLLKQLRDERDWAKFHDPKNVAEALSIEAGELLELFLWKTKEEIATKLTEDAVYRQKVEEELADIFNYCLTFANSAGIDIASAVKQKIEKNKQKYPVEKAKGVATKYNEL